MISIRATYKNSMGNQVTYTGGPERYEKKENRPDGLKVISSIPQPPERIANIWPPRDENEWIGFYSSVRAK